jgi:TolA-binding protein
METVVQHPANRNPANRKSNRGRWKIVRSIDSVLIWVLLATLVGWCSASRAQETTDKAPTAAETSDNEAALASYADAANFQTRGELELAIEQWQKFLVDFPSDPLAPRASHYLGVCYMQLPTPDYAAAANAFEKALKNDQYSLREESLSNLGWCLYAVASDPEQPKPERFNDAIATFKQLIDQFPTSKFADRAMFYQGEALYAQGKPREAIAQYDALLDSRSGKDSSMRCDAIYAKGVALEDLKEYDRAIEAYRQMLSQCGDDPLTEAVRFRLAEVLILQQKPEEAERIFATLIEAGGDGVPRALYRRAFVLTQLGRTDQAAGLYDRLVDEFPQSPFAASAIMSAAQGYYLSGQFDQAAKRFQQVIEAGTNAEAATEAAHWISVIAMREGRLPDAEKVATEQIGRGVEGPFATTLRLDAAEAISMQAGREAEGLAALEAILAESPNDPLVPRILYNAAFTALQLGQPEKSLEFTKRYFQTGGEGPLAADLRYIAAEANLASGNVADAVTEYNQLLQVAGEENPQFGFWVLRAASANFAAGNFDTVISILEERMPLFQQETERAEAYFLIGSSQLSSDRPAEAIASFEAGLQTGPTWPRRDEMMFRLAVACQADGNLVRADEVWQAVVENYPRSKMADQSRYRLAQQALSTRRFDQAVRWYEELLTDTADPVLKPFALYGKARTLMERGGAAEGAARQSDYRSAVETLTNLIETFPQHGFYDDALLARGMSRRRLDELPAATADLTAFLDLEPIGVNLGNALFELALIDRQQDQTEAAIEKLRRIVNELPDYPEIDKVSYELAELLEQAGDIDGAIAMFQRVLGRDPESPFAADASYKIGQLHYANKQWQQAAEAYAKTAESTDDVDLLEKTLYRLGWSHYQLKDFDLAADAFRRQSQRAPEGNLSIDALMMVGESYFAKSDYENALKAYEQARQAILERDGEDRKFTDDSERQVRELVFLHGGQSAAQLKKWDVALAWFDQMRNRYSASSYLSQVFYETGLAHRMLNDNDQAMKFFNETANKFYDESAARARFMIGQIDFEQGRLADAIQEFKRVMYGFGAEKAPEPIRDWQAKSGFEAGRCAERLIQSNDGQRRQQAIELAKKYYQFVVDNHASHPLAAKSRDRIEVLNRM